MISSLASADVVPIAPEHIEGYRRAVDMVARERRYLTVLEAFPLAQTRDFVLGLMKKGDPMFVAAGNGEVVGWCDIQRHPFPAHSHRERSAWDLFRTIAAAVSALDLWIAR